MPARERVVGSAIALAFLAAVALLSVVFPHDRAAHPMTLVLLVVVLAVCFNVSFEIGGGLAHPSALAFAPMLFLAPLHLVPLLAAVAALLAETPDFLLRRKHVTRWLVILGSSWWSIGPVLVVGLLAPGPPRAAHAPVYAAAFLSETLLGMVYAAITQRLRHNVPMLETARLFVWSARIDLAFTPMAYALAVAATAAPAVLASVMPVAWIIESFSRERGERYNAILDLNQAYRGTVMMLADVVEADDQYTAHHSRSVVELATEAGRTLGLSPDALQELEMVALMHDVGKIAIPKEILNKPAKLTDEEFELMKTHTIEGQHLLDRVGGKLARVGEIVRSCHERWDGNGYPDGLAGEQIPLAARIVFACDAYSAMTTDRPYRRAMSQATAIEQLEENSGTQFDPRVVTALERVVLAGEPLVGDAYADAVRTVLASSAPLGLEGSVQ